MISVVIPTYNEKENITKLIPLMAESLSGYEYEIIVVDDNSPDHTADIAEELSNDYPIIVLRRDRKLGLASAILHGFRNGKGNILGVIDADLQHPPRYIKEFADAINNGYDIAIGSRYVEGGRIEGWGKSRYIVSRGAIILSKPLTNIKDPMSGYFFIKRDVVSNISFSSIGYKLLLEILTKGSYDSVIEIPYTFSTRKNGNSKLGKGEYINYLNLLFDLYKFKIKKRLKKR